MSKEESTGPGYDQPFAKTFMVGARQVLYYVEPGDDETFLHQIVQWDGVHFNCKLKFSNEDVAHKAFGMMDEGTAGKLLEMFDRVMSGGSIAG